MPQRTKGGKLTKLGRFEREVAAGVALQRCLRGEVLERGAILRRIELTQDRLLAEVRAIRLTCEDFV
jgi:hypothetical protein